MTLCTFQKSRNELRQTGGWCCSVTWRGLFHHRHVSHSNSQHHSSDFAFLLGQISKSIIFLWPQAKRRISSIIGAVVADAASLPLEWIYKDATMKVNIIMAEEQLRRASLTGNSWGEESWVLAWKQVPFLLFTYRQPQLLWRWTGKYCDEKFRQDCTANPTLLLLKCNPYDSYYEARSLAWLQWLQLVLLNQKSFRRQSSQSLEHQTLLIRWPALKIT